MLLATHGIANNADSQVRPGARVDEGRHPKTSSEPRHATGRQIWGLPNKKRPGTAPKACPRVAFALEALCATFKTVSRWLPRGLPFPVARAT